MHRIGYYLGVSKHAEVIFLVVIGITCTIFDSSIFNLKSNLEQVWNLTMDERIFSEEVQKYLKYTLTGIISVKTFTVHIYLAFYVVLLWPAIFEDKPNLILPWLAVGLVRCLLTSIATFCMGIYVCGMYKFKRPVCAEFPLVQILENGPAVYTWFCILSYYRELKSNLETYKIIVQNKNNIEFEKKRKRKESRLKSSESQGSINEKLDDNDRKIISVSTIENAVKQLAKNSHDEPSRSMDSLLKQMETEAEAQEILGSINDAKEEIEKDDTLSVQEKVMKILELTSSEIIKAKLNVQKIRAEMEDSLKAMEMQSELQSGDEYFSRFQFSSKVHYTTRLHISQNDESNKLLKVNNPKNAVTLDNELISNYQFKTTRNNQKLISKDKNKEDDITSKKNDLIPTNNSEEELMTISMDSLNTSKQKPSCIPKLSKTSNTSVSKTRNFIPGQSRLPVPYRDVKTNTGKKMCIRKNLFEKENIKPRTSSFQEDGYTLAYLEKEKQKKLEYLHSPKKAISSPVKGGVL